MATKTAKFTMKVNTQKIGNVRALVYKYSTDEEIGFEFHTLAEVGEPWQDAARAESERVASFWGLTIAHGVEIEQYPWVVDALV